MVDVLGGTARGLEDPKRVQGTLHIWMCEIYFNTFMLHVMKITQTD